MSGNNVRVVCRFRPQNQKELALGGDSVVFIEDNKETVTIKGTESPHTFTFDRIFGGDCTQKEVYEYAARPVVEDIMKGYNGTIFVYGQTSSGKTHTMQGPSIDDPELKGIIPRMNGTIFEGVMKADQNIEFLVKASYIEIYMEKIRDLLDAKKNNLQVREEKTKGIWVDGVTEVYVNCEEDVLEVIRVGSANRAIAETKMNSESSRSHSIFILTISQKNLSDLSNKSGKLYLVDLAGSEKIEKTGAQGTTLDEAKMINKSLSALGNVINSLTDGKSTHVPYRDSKLTRVLQESLGGNSRTTLVINCSPSGYNEAETLSTLRFGSRAKSIKNQAKVNQELSVAELKIRLDKAKKIISEHESTIRGLQDQVAVLEGGEPIHRKPVTASSSSDDKTVVVDTRANLLLQEQIIELQEQIRKLEEEKQTTSELYESMSEDLKEKEQEIEQMERELNQVRSAEQTTSKENEMLIVKLADLTISNEKMMYESSENQLTLETSNGKNNALQEEIDALKKKIDSLTNERNQSVKSDAMTKLAQEEWRDKGDDAPVSDRTEDVAFDGMQNILSEKKKLVDHDTLVAFRVEIESQKREIEQLKREKELQQVELQKLQTEFVESKPSTLQAESDSTDSSPQMRKLERELQMVKDHTNQKLSEFDVMKAALLRDLENRCQKVVELEILLDEAREQYQTLLNQVKNSNSKTLQQKCAFLQRNLEQLTTVQQQLVNENNRLKLENQVYVKHIAIRNERIHGLELLLQDAQEKLQKHASSQEASVHASPAQKKVLGSTRPKKPQAPQLNVGGGRIAKPLRGGGGGGIKAAEEEPKKSGSIWDLFRGGKQDSPVTSPTKPAPNE